MNPNNWKDTAKLTGVEADSVWRPGITRIRRISRTFRVPFCGGTSNIGALRFIDSLPGIFTLANTLYFQEQAR
jgi:hypothetical protein